jgi:hypothetical protein
MGTSIIKERSHNKSRDLICDDDEDVIILTSNQDRGICIYVEHETVM